MQVIQNESASKSIYYEILTCQHCAQDIFFLYKGYTPSLIKGLTEELIKIQNFGSGSGIPELIKSLKKQIKESNKELIIQHPFSLAYISYPKIPKKAVKAFLEAQNCFYKANSLTGTVANLRKVIYIICDDKIKTSQDYDKKVLELFPPGSDYSQLMNQIKWLADKHVHPDEAENIYTSDNVKKALEIFPEIVKELYAKQEDIKNVKNILNQSYQKTKSKK